MKSIPKSTNSSAPANNIEILVLLIGISILFIVCLLKLLVVFTMLFLILTIKVPVLLLVAAGGE